MKLKLTPRPSEGAERIRNIIAGSLVWGTAVAVVVFLILDPSDTVEMQLATESSVQDIAITPDEDSVDSDISQLGEEIADSELDSDTSGADQQTTTESQEVSESDSSTPEMQTSSIVYEGDAEQEPESVQTESEVTQTASVQSPTEAPEKVTETAEPAEATVAQTTNSLRRELFIQVAAFSSADNAEGKRKEYSKELYPVSVVKDDNGMNLVLVGPYLTESEAERIRAELVLKFQLEGSFLKFVDREPVKVASAENNSTELAENATAVATPAGEKAEVTDGWYVRVGAFKNLGNARTSKLRVEKLNLSTIIKREKQLNVLMVGPFQEENDAKIAMNRIFQELKIKDAYLVRVSS